MHRINKTVVGFLVKSILNSLTDLIGGLLLLNEEMSHSKKKISLKRIKKEFEHLMVVLKEHFIIFFRNRIFKKTKQK